MERTESSENEKTIIRKKIARKDGYVTTFCPACNAMFMVRNTRANMYYMDCPGTTIWCQQCKSGFILAEIHIGLVKT